jgi:ATP-dependent Clp protease, protease subunit
MSDQSKQQTKMSQEQAEELDLTPECLCGNCNADTSNESQDLTVEQQEAIAQHIQAMMEAQNNDPPRPFSHSELQFYGPDTRCLYFTSEINEATAAILISQIHALEYISEEDPIKITVNTPGGEVHSALAIYDAIRNSPCIVYVEATGLCASGGLIILAAGDARLATENTVFFYHEAITGHEVNSVHEMRSKAGMYEVLQAKMEEIIKKQTKIKAALWRKYFAGSTSFFFDVVQAEEFGFIHSVVRSGKPKIQSVKPATEKKKK